MQAFFFFFVLEWLKVREGGKNASALKEILCNREQIAVLPGGGGAVKVLMSCSKYDLTRSSDESMRKVRWGLI